MKFQTKLIVASILLIATGSVIYIRFGHGSNSPALIDSSHRKDIEISASDIQLITDSIRHQSKAKIRTVAKPNESIESAAFQTAYRRLIVTDPIAAWDFLATRENMSEIARLISMWCDSATPEALSIALGQPYKGEPAALGFFRYRLLKELASKDPQAALASARNSFPPGLSRDKAIHETLSVMHGLNPEAAIKELKQLGDVALRNRIVGDFLKQSLEANPNDPNAWNIIRSFDTQSALHLLAGDDKISELMVKGDPDLLQNLLQQAVITQSNANLTLDIVKKVGKTDPKLALQMLLSGDLLLPKEGVDQVVSHNAMAIGHQQGGLEFLRAEIDKADVSQVDSLIKGVGMSLALKPQEFNNFLSSINPEKHSAAAQGYFDAYMMVSSTIPLAKPMISEENSAFQLLPNSSQRDLVSQIVGATGDRQEAINWVDSLGREDLRESGYEAIARSWSARDPQWVAEWLNHMPAGEAKNGVIKVLVGELEGVDPESAAQWRKLLPP